MASPGAGTPQARKLGIASGCRLLLDGAPAGWALEDPPHDLVVLADAEESAEVAVAFFTAADQLAPRLPTLAKCIFPDGSLWVAWPRRAGGHQSDITDVIVRRCALELDIVDVKVAAIDEDWSGLLFVWRVSRRGPRR